MNRQVDQHRTPGDDTPVFVYGALRSGTTLLRVMLKSHPELQSPGEADFLFDHIVYDEAARDGWRYDRKALCEDRILKAKNLEFDKSLDGRALLDAMIDAMARANQGRLFVSVHRHAPRIATLFPTSPIIHLLRDPRDVARSSIGMGWAGTSYHGVGHWIDTETAWDAAAFNPENVHELRFEELMDDVEGHLIKICRFLGLEFDSAMRRYWEGSSYGPPEPQIAEKWRQQADCREVAIIEGRVGELLERRGYTAAGRPAFLSHYEWLRLTAAHRLHRWRYNSQRYGTLLSWSYRAARILRMRSLQSKLGRRKDAIKIRNLK